jgi:hypothetical protein
MRRLFFATFLSIAMLAPAARADDDIVFHGENDSGGHLSFLAHERLGKYRGVHPFLTGQVVLQCAGGRTGRSFNLTDAMSVGRTGHFSGVHHIVMRALPDEHATVRIAGQFIHKQRDAIGTLRVHIEDAVNPHMDGCDSGVLNWTTHGN